MNKKKTILASLILLLIVVVGGAIAYFTDTDEKRNTFTIGSVDISLSESNWSLTDTNPANGIPDAAENLMPGQTVLKNPVISNESVKNAAYVFAKLEVPCTTETTPQEIFTYSINDDSWTELTDEAIACTSGNSATHVYYYGTEGTLSTLAKATDGTPVVPTPTSEALFDSVTVRGTLDGSEGLTGNKTIVVTGYGIQKDGLENSTPSVVWGYFS